MLRKRRIISFVVSICAVLIATSPVKADQPGVTMRSGTLIDPAAALTVYNNPVSPAAPTTADPLLAELARSLRYDVDLIYEHIRDNVDFVPVYGLQRGARGAIYDENGTAFDQAQLMVELLREADRQASKGYNPQYKLGRITLTGAQFNDWFGISNADVARKVLADGGIPATVVGSGTTFTSVTMSHIWVQVTIGGVNYLFDPSYKPHLRNPKIDVAAISGYDRTALLNAASTGATYNGSSIKDFNTASFNSQLNSYRSTLETYLKDNLPGRKIGSVIGGLEILPHTASEMRRTSLPYVAGVDATWGGEIPDVYRVRVTLTMVGGTGSSGVLFADAIYGKQFQWSFGYSGGVWSIGSNGAENFSSSSGDNCGVISSGSRPTPIVSIAIDHPYAASSGAYMDRTLTKPMSGQTTSGCTGGFFLFTFDFGMEGTRRLTDLRRQETRAGMGPSPPIDVITAPTFKSVAVSFSRYVELADLQLDLVTQVHDVVGVHNLDSLWSYTNNGMQTWSPQKMLAIDFEAGISANSRTDITGPRTNAAKYVATMGLAMAESAVPRQELDSVREISPLTVVTNQNTLSAFPASYTHYLLTSANWTSMQSTLSSNGYTNEAIGIIGNYINDGYSVLAPQRGDITPGAYSDGSVVVKTVETSGGTSQISRPAFFAFRSTGSVLNSAGLVTFDPRRGRAMKGGAGVQTQTSNSTPIDKPAEPKPELKDPVFSALRVEPGTGALNYSPPPDLRDGSGQYALEFRRSYNSQDLSDIGLGVGWTHNWKNTVELSGDGLGMFGHESALGTASTLIGQQTAFDLALSGVTDPRTMLAILKSQQWVVAQSLNNLAIIDDGSGEQKTFARIANGTFAPIEPDGGLLTQSGAPIDTVLNRWGYGPVTFNYTGSDGTTRAYAYVAAAAGNPSVDWLAAKLTRKTFYMSSSTLPAGVKLVTEFNLQNLVDAIYLVEVKNSLGNDILDVGRDMDTGETGQAGGSAYCTYPYNNQPVQFYPFRPGMIKYQDSAQNRAEFRKTPSYHFSVNQIWLDEGGNCGMSGLLPGLYLAYTPILIGASAPAAAGQPAGPEWTYKPSAPLSWGPLTAIYKPSNSTTPAAQIVYRQNETTESITDAVSQVSTYRSAPRRLDTEDPLGGSTVIYVDQLRRPTRSIDQLGRETTTTYNDAGQVMRTVAPEGNAIEYLYDPRGNKTQECRIAKGRVVWSSLADPKVTQCNSALGDLVTTVAYVGGPTLRMDQCVNLKTCNKPLYTIDPKGNRTNFAWDGTTGLLLSQTRGLDQLGNCAVAGGTCPMTTNAYTAFTGTDGATFYLLTSKTEKIDATSTTTTAYSYDTANKFALKTMTVDSGGLNLRTCGKFDAVGNLISMSDPRQGACP